MKPPNPASRPPRSRHGQATAEMLLAFAELLLALQLLVFLANFGLNQALGFSDAQARRLLAQKSLVLGVLCSDGENSSVSLSTPHPASMKGKGHLLTNPAQTVSAMTLPGIEPDPAAGGIRYSCGNSEIPT